jgi:hypothetical protein
MMAHVIFMGKIKLVTECLVTWMEEVTGSRWDDIRMGLRRLNKHIYYVKHHTGFILIQVVPLHVHYMFWPFLRPS